MCCTFSIVFCGEKGEWCEDLEDRYCPCHARALRSFAEEGPLARLSFLGPDYTRSPFGLLKNSEVDEAIAIIREEYLDAIEIRWVSLIGTHWIWLRPGHKFLELCEEELREAGCRHNYRISRSRPYHKEDNGHVEQKNNDKVRKLVGYHRYDTEEQVKLLNRLYEIEDLISNFFLPSQKLIKKIVDDKGRVVNRKHGRAKTAYRRLTQAKGVSQKTKKRAREVYDKLNLVELRRESEKIQKRLYRTVISRKTILI